MYGVGMVEIDGSVAAPMAVGFGDFYETEYRPLRRLALALTGSPAPADDLVNGKEQTGDPASHKLYNLDVVVIAFAAKEAPYPGRPPSVRNLPQSLNHEIALPETTP